MGYRIYSYPDLGTACISLLETYGYITAHDLAEIFGVVHRSIYDALARYDKTLVDYGSGYSLLNVDVDEIEEYVLVNYHLTGKEIADRFGIESQQLI